MTLGLRPKLVISFLVVIVITGSMATMVGIQQIRRGVVREAQSKVTLDLNSAYQIYTDALEDIEREVRFVAGRTFAVRKALREGNNALLLDALQQGLKEGSLDLLTLTDGEGNVILRARNPGAFGDHMGEDPLVAHVLRERSPAASTVLASRSELIKESVELAERARIPLVPTPRAKPTAQVESTAGMLLKAAAPVFDDTGAFAGVLYGGVLLNRNDGMVDKIKDIVYRGVTYKGKDVGTATIFQKDLRISTNVRSLDGARAIGTRVSSEVYDRVIGEGKTWEARAFVVNDWYLTAYMPLRNMSGDVIGILYVGMLEEKYRDMTNNALLTFGGIMAGGIVLALVIAYGLSHALTNPIRALKRGVEAIAEGDFDFRVSASSGDEIGVLADSFNRVRQQLKETYERLHGKIESADEDLKNAYRALRKKQEQLVKAERLASMGQLAAGVAHELNNPLGTILIYSHMLLKNPGESGSNKEDVEMIVREATRCREIVRGLLDFARQSRVSKSAVHLDEVVRNVLAVMASRAQEKGVQLRADVQEDLPVIMADANQIKQALINLVQNGIDAVSNQGEVTISVKLHERDEAVEINVTDNGCGIPHENLSKLFTPFFTTKANGKGTGLGLAITYGVVKMHSGDITVHSQAGEGTTFSVCIPTK